MSSDKLPKEFDTTTQVLPFTKYGVSSVKEFTKAEKELQHLEWLNRIGLTSEEIKLYQENEDKQQQRNKIESSVLSKKLEYIYERIRSSTFEKSLKDDQPSTSSASNETTMLQACNPTKAYPEGHPMNDLIALENNLFGHLKTELLPITKRRKLLRRLERKTERILNEDPSIQQLTEHMMENNRKNSLWDVKEVVSIPKPAALKPKEPQKDDLIGPKQQTKYTIKDGKIVRLEPLSKENTEIEYKAVNIVLPVNKAEERMLEGIKMSLEDIKKIERFKDYEPGFPSKVLYLKNIAPSVTEEQVSQLFVKYHLSNGGKIDVRLMTGRMRGQAFVGFEDENVAIRALEDVNGTILSGRPVIIQFGKNCNKIQDNTSL